MFTGLFVNQNTSCPFHRIETELQHLQHLLTDTEELSHAAINLLLSGSATPHLHNDTLFYDEHGDTLVKTYVKMYKNQN